MLSMTYNDTNKIKKTTALKDETYIYTSNQQNVKICDCGVIYDSSSMVCFVTIYVNLNKIENTKQKNRQLIP